MSREDDETLTRIVTTAPPAPQERETLPLPPRKAFEVTIRTNGHTYQEVLVQLAEAYRHLRANPESFVGDGLYVEVETNPHQTRSSYLKELDEYLSNVKRQNKEIKP